MIKKLRFLPIVLIPFLFMSLGMANEGELLSPWILAIIKKFIESNPTLSQIIFFVGLLRLIIKPIMTIIQTYVRSTPTSSDDEWFDKISNSNVYKMILFILDWLASVKIRR